MSHNQTLTEILSNISLKFGEILNIEKPNLLIVQEDTTERPEGITAGFAKIIGTDVINNFDWVANNYKWDGENPYGDGSASIKIVDSIIKNLN